MLCNIDFAGTTIINKKHPEYGYGLIDKIDDDYLDVYYEEVGTKTYEFPKCFIESYIEFEDKTLEDIILDIVVEEEKQHNLKIKQQKDLEKQLRQGRDEPQRKILKYGDYFTSHHQILNECFSQNYKLAVRGGYQIDNFIGVWFPIESKYYGGIYLPVCDEGWVNIFDVNLIKEQNEIRTFKDDSMAKLERCVFAKFLNKNDNYKPGYYFIGVYSPLDSKENPRLSYDRQYIKVAKDFNLLTMEPKYFKKE